LSSGLTAYYPFNGSADDESGNGNNAVVSGAALTTDRFGNSAAAYAFDGVNDFVELSPDVPTTENQTISLWVKVPSTEMDSALLTLSKSEQYWLYVSSDNKLLVSLDGSGGTVDFKSTSDINNNTWNHVAITREGDSHKLYINSELEISYTFTPDIMDRLNGLFAKYSGSSWEKFTAGSADDVRIYNRPLSVEEIEILYDGYVPHVTAFTAVPGDGQVDLNWTAPTYANFAGVRIVRKTGDYPSSESDGVVVYENSGTTYTDTGVTNDTTYYYSIFVYSDASEYSTGINQSATPNPYVVPTTGLVAEYLFDGDASDTGGNNIHGTVAGPILTTDRFGTADQAFYFDGADDYISMPVNSNFNFGTGNFSYNFWIRTTDNAYLIDARDSSNERGFIANINMDINGTELRSILGNGSGAATTAVSTTQYADGIWHCIGVVREGNRLYHYIDGVLIAENSASDPVIDIGVSNTTYIGRRMASTPAGGFFTGVFDDLRIYNRALTQSELQSIYHENGYDPALYTYSVAADGLVAEYLFSGNPQDTSGNGLHGTIAGATLTSDRYGSSNSAYSFSGSRITIADNILLEAEAVSSVSVWFSSTSTSDQQSILSKYRSDTPGEDGWIVRTTTSWFKTNAGVAVPQVTKPGFATNTWYHLVFTYNLTDKTEKLFMNGVLVDEDPWTETFTFGGNSLSLGIGYTLTNSSTYTGYFYGKIDDVRIYNRELSVEEILGLYSE
jgi:hypothetical protein